MVLFSRLLAVLNYLFVILAVLIGSLDPASCFAQGPATGAPPFSSLAGSPDVMNLGNLNVHWTIPVLHKPGRGLNFNFDLNYDSLIWTPVTSSGTTSWQPAAAWGWTSSLLSVGNIVNSVTISHGTCFDQHHIQHSTTSYTWSGWTYIDAFGTPHRFAGTSGHTDGCTVSSYGFTGATALDGSGYTLTTYGASATSLYGRDGSLINAPVDNFGATGGATDRNGNQISYNSTTGVFTDTLGTAALTRAGASPNPVTYSYPAPSGATAPFTVKFTSYSVRTNFGCSQIGEYGPTNNNLVSEIDLPDIAINSNDRYTFTYETTPGDMHNPPYVTGRLKSITLPTGGTITYSYSGGSNGINCADGSTATLTRATPDGTWTYAQVKNSGAASTTTVTDPAGDITAVNFQGIYETSRVVSDVNQGTLVTTNTCYNGASIPCTGTAITLPITARTVSNALPGSQNLTDQHAYTYDGYGNLLTQVDYDYGSGAKGNLLGQTTITYASLGNSITAFRQTVTVTNSTGATVSKTNYNYDQFTPQGTSGTPQHVLVTGSRGNLTSVNYYKQGSTSLTTSNTYFDTGNVQTATDVNGAQTTYSYGACGNSFLTNVQEPLNMSRSFAWNCTGGVQTQVTDENVKSTSASYVNDNYYWRSDSTTDALGNQTSYNYVPNASNGLPYGAASFLTFNNSNSQVSLAQYMDGLGRKYVDQRRQGPNGTGLDTVSYTFDASGRAYSVSMPCSVTWTQTCSTPKTTQTYDALNRPLVTTDGGGGTVTNTYLQNDVLVAVGSPSKKRQLEYDSLGRLTSVCEITTLPGSGTCGQTNPQTGYWTRYKYDPLGNILGVCQLTTQPLSTDCVQSPSSGQQTRSYVYDLLGRITSETHPENGSTTYIWDSASVGVCNIASMGDLIVRTDAAGVSTCNAYDSLHRLRSIGHNPGWANSTPDKFFVYDSATINGVNMTNVVGRLAEAYTCFSPCTKLTDELFSYTPRGESSDVYESTPNSGGYYHTSQTYYANGALNLLTDSVGYQAGWNVDVEGRPNYSTGSNPVSGTIYNTASQPTQINFSSGDSDSYSYDPNTSRMTQYKFSVGSQFVAGNLTWNANGTLQNLSIQDNFNPANTQTCGYQHDDLVRIASVNCPGNTTPNTGFEQALTGWSTSWTSPTVVSDVSRAHSGNDYLQLTGNASGCPAGCSGALSQQLSPVQPGQQVTFGGWAYLESGGGGITGWCISFVDSHGTYFNPVCAPNPTTTGSWVYQSATYSAPANAAQVLLYVQVWQPTSTTVLRADDGFLDDVPIWSQTFNYDAFGNISKSGSVSFAASYNPATNHISSVGGFVPTYDANGNTLADPAHSYSWDSSGKPVAIDGVNLTYDALGRVVEQNRSGNYTQILYAPSGFKMHLVIGQTTNVEAFVPLPGGTTAVYTNAAAYIRHADWLGSSRFASILSSRSMYYDGAYAPFGEPYAQSGTTDLSFTGMNQDTVANLYDFPAREYTGAQGRWPSPDPAGLAAVDPTNPQSWNRYAYVLNNPLAYVDPTGLSACFITVVDESGFFSSEEIPAGDQQVCQDRGGTWVNTVATTVNVSGDDGSGGSPAGGCASFYQDGVYIGNVCGGPTPPGGSGGGGGGNGGVTYSLNASTVADIFLWNFKTQARAGLINWACKNNQSTRILTSMRNGAIFGAARGAYTGFVSGEALGGSVTFGASGLAGAAGGALIGAAAGSIGGFVHGAVAAQVCQTYGAYGH